MENHEIFILTYGVLTFLTVVVLSLLELQFIDVYLGLFAVELFVTSELIPPIASSESRKRLVMKVMMIVIFMGAILKRIMILFGVAR